MALVKKLKIEINYKLVTFLKFQGVEYIIPNINFLF